MDCHEYAQRLMGLLVGAPHYLDDSPLKQEVKEVIAKPIQHTQAYCKRLCKLLREVNSLVPRGSQYAVSIGDALTSELWENWPDDAQAL